MSFKMSQDKYILYIHVSIRSLEGNFISYFSDSKRPLTEPPIPGYHGYIPRIKTTEQGLGCRYNQSTKQGLEMFVHETAAHARSVGGDLPKSLKRYIRTFSDVVQFKG